MKLNLARSWRSKTFDELIGQDLAVRILKNSLYTKSFFPVYLFSGQRGCGKTSAARIFASAVNCQGLYKFQQDPKLSAIPCLSCQSCNMMQAGKHPDFIEIDAASHTGVDHIRQVIDAATLLPVMAGKKIYLIDEAHMLSRAAFNAFLKLLEEPPASVLFILATTEYHKILDTVLSRCFQVFFNPIAPQIIEHHLALICDQEEIKYDASGLQAIAQQSEGSARDAINLLEHVRFSCDVISRQIVMKVLGKLSIQQLRGLLDALVLKNTEQFLIHWAESRIEEFNPQSSWNSIVQCFSDLVTYSLGGKIQYHVLEQSDLQALVKGRTAQELFVPLDIMYQHEAMFLKTTTPHSCLKYVLLKVIAKQVIEPDQIDSMPSNQEKSSTVKASIEKQSCNQLWQKFIEKLPQVKDPLVISIFKRANFVDYKDKQVILRYASNLTFFNDIVEKTRSIWLPILHKSFDPSAMLKMHFDGKDLPSAEVHVPDRKESDCNKSPVPRPEIRKKQNQARNAKPSLKSLNAGKKIDITDEKKWKKVHQVMRIFPGTITEILEKQHG